MGAGLPAMQATRSFGYTEVMLSQASQLPQVELVSPVVIEQTGLSGLQAT